MLVCPVACVDHWHRCHAGSHVGGSCLRVAHHNHVHVVGDYLDGVFKRLALGLGRIPVIRETDHPCPKTVYGGFEREPSPG